MAIMDPGGIPAGRAHLDPDDRRLLLRMELCAQQGRFEEAQDLAEELWLEAVDAHKRLYQGLANAFTAAAARAGLQRRGAREIAGRTRRMLEPYPRRVLDLDLDALLDSLDALVERGDGTLLMRRQG